jgi:TM2 domain-containing membrane protein YozV
MVMEAGLALQKDTISKISFRVLIDNPDCFKNAAPDCRAVFFYHLTYISALCVLQLNKHRIYLTLNYHIKLIYLNLENMKKILVTCFFSALLLCGTNSFAGTSEYFVDDAAIEQVLEGGIQVMSDITSEKVADALAAAQGIQGQAKISADKSEAVAFILSWVVGFLGVHRIYMGTSGGVIVGYILTCGGLGIVALIDWIVLLIALVDDDKNIEKYIDSKKFFMWAN